MVPFSVTFGTKWQNNWDLPKRRRLAFLQKRHREMPHQSLARPTIPISPAGPRGESGIIKWILVFSPKTRSFISADEPDQIVVLVVACSSSGRLKDLQRIIDDW
jgi:hypothetical protein